MNLRPDCVLTCGCSLAVRTEASQASSPGSNPGSRTSILLRRCLMSGMAGRLSVLLGSTVVFHSYDDFSPCVSFSKIMERFGNLT